MLRIGLPRFMGWQLWVAVGMLAIAAVAAAQDISPTYQWKPVRIGGGGYVVGMVIHPLNPNVRYIRTDVGNAYRWDVANQQWDPMKVSNTNGTGVQGPDASAPSSGGEESIAVDPANVNTVYMVYPTVHSCDIQCPTNLDEIYKSTDGGLNFSPANMESAAIMGNANATHRTLGERLMVDPANSQVLYYGTETQGLFRSLDGGATWAQFSGTSSPPTNIEFVNIQFPSNSGTVSVSGVTVSKVVYAVSVNNSDAGGDVYQSQDGGQTWTDISTGVTDTASGQPLSKQALTSSMDAANNLYIPENSSTDGYHRAYWRYSAGVWTRFSLDNGGLSQPVAGVAVDPSNPLRIYALGADTGLSRSDDGGQTWTNFGSAVYANTLGWLPQTVGMASGEWHSNGTLKVDSAGNLWTPTGQEGPLTMTSATAVAGTAANPPKWTIVTTGVEEMVSQDIAIPPGSNDTILATAEDTTGFTIPNPDNFSAVEIPLQQEIISQGTSVDYAPDAPSYIAVATSNVYTNGTNYSGYSTDGGHTWTRFGAPLQFSCSTTAICDVPAGIIAVSVRGNRTLGSDHLALYPPENLLPEYSQDGGATWHVTSSFPAGADGVSLNTGNGSYVSFVYPELHQHQLRADPFVADKFYLKMIHAPSSFYISTDGGKTWTGQSNANLPDYTWNGQLAVNSKAVNDLWFADGFEGALTHGLFHSTDGGVTFQQVSGITHAATLAVGAGSGNTGDAAYSVYFYGLMSGDANWGVFRSTDAGSSWQRIAYYPTGIYDRPNTMAASQDNFGKVYLGFGGNSFVYGQPILTVSLPGAPTSLAATAATNTQVNLSWSAPGTGTVSSYNVYRGTSAGGESATPVATAVTATTYQDTGLTMGSTYYYQVAAVNSAGVGPRSNESSAVAAQPALQLTAATGSQTSATISPGGTATFNLVLDSTNFTGAVTFTCSGAPAGDQCSVPSTVTLTPATTATPVTVTVGTSAAANRHAGIHFGHLLPFAAGFVLLPMFFGSKRRRGAAILFLAMIPISLWTGCGSGSQSSSSTTFTVTVSASGPGGVTATEPLIVTVQ